MCTYIGWSTLLQPDLLAQSVFVFLISASSTGGHILREEINWSISIKSHRNAFNI